MNSVCDEICCASEMRDIIIQRTRVAMRKWLIAGLSVLLLATGAALAKDGEIAVGQRGNSYGNSSPIGNASVGTKRIRLRNVAVFR
jgi:hypothetical protein